MTYLSKRCGGGSVILSTTQPQFDRATHLLALTCSLFFALLMRYLIVWWRARSRPDSDQIIRELFIIAGACCDTTYETISLSLERERE